MTRLTKTVRRLVDLPRGPTWVSLHPGAVIGFKEKGKRIEYILPLAPLFVRAADAFAQQRKADRRAARRAARGR